MPIVAVAAAAVGGIAKLAQGKVGKAIGRGFKKIGSLFGRKKKAKAKEAAKQNALTTSPAMTTVKTAGDKGVVKNALVTGAKAAYNDLIKGDQPEVVTDQEGSTVKTGNNNKNLLIGGAVLCGIGLAAIIFKKRNT